MAVAEFFFQLAIAIGIGGLIGVEREHRGEQTTVIAGVRTFPLVSVTGLLVAFLARETDVGLILPIGVGGAFGLALMFISMRQSMGLVGLTTPVVMVVTFLLGVLIGYGFTFEAVVIGVVATFLLLTKKRLHNFAQYLDDAEILSALQFITLLFILLPLTAAMRPPVFDQTWLGRGALVDPYAILLVVVFVSSISFASFIAMRMAGADRGIAYSGLLGGLVNSEATTASLAQRALAQPALVQGAVVGALLATTTMFARNLAIAAVADPKLGMAIALAPLLAPLALLSLLLAWRGQVDRRERIEPVRVKNPFAVIPALRFAAVFAIITVLAKLGSTSFGQAGVYATALGGVVSAGAVVAGVSTLYATGDVALGVAVRTCVLAVTASIAVKLFILRAVNREVLKHAAVPFLVLSGAGVAVAVISFSVL